MEDGDHKETNEVKEESKEDKPISIVEEARAIRDEIRTEREKLEEANKESKEIKATEMLSGTTGARVETIPKEETPQDYAKRVMSGEAGND